MQPAATPVSPCSAWCTGGKALSLRAHSVSAGLALSRFEVGPTSPRPHRGNQPVTEGGPPLDGDRRAGVEVHEDPAGPPCTSPTMAAEPSKRTACTGSRSRTARRSVGITESRSRTCDRPPLWHEPLVLDRFGIAHPDSMAKDTGGAAVDALDRIAGPRRCSVVSGSASIERSSSCSSQCQQPRRLPR